MFNAILIFIYLLLVTGGSVLISYAYIGPKFKFKQFVNIFLPLLFVFSWLIFIFIFSDYKHEHNVPIVLGEQGYSPFSQHHLISLFCFMVLSFIGNYNIFRKGKNAPPLLVLLNISFIVAGIILCAIIIIQLSSNDNSVYLADSLGPEFMFVAPVTQIIISVLLITKLIRSESVHSNQRNFKNKGLNFLNQKLQVSNQYSLWTLVLLLPFYLLIFLILIIFGQEYDSLSKVFTETTTWYYSEKTHPPFLDHQGHYLCTIAVCGDPKIVKPVRLGTRHEHVIIVNRQLMIANAFEDVIMRKSPKLHAFIRKNYDKYGYPLSKKINTKAKSNFTYIVMKPIEWMFLIFIYLVEEKPEKLIEKQYALSNG